MKDTLVMYARYAKRADESVLALLDKLSPEAREEDRKSYYKSLSALARHILGGITYFHGLFRASLPATRGALKPTEGMKEIEGALDAGQWKAFKASFAIADQTTLDFVSGLGEGDLALPVKLDWYGGKPASVPLGFMLHQLIVHGIHHRGQISQILDEMGVEHDFSGIDLEFLV